MLVGEFLQVVSVVGVTSRRCNLSDIVGFGAPDLLPVFLNTFIQKILTLRHYERNASYLSAVFEGQGSLGSQTDVYVVDGAKQQLYRYCWSHPGRSPFGTPLPVFCPKCRSYKPWHRPQISDNNHIITNCCAGCGYFKRASGMKKWTRGCGLSTGTEGDWFVSKRALKTLREYFQNQTAADNIRDS